MCSIHHTPYTVPHAQYTHQLSLSLYDKGSDGVGMWLPLLTVEASGAEVQCTNAAIVPVPTPNTPMALATHIS